MFDIFLFTLAWTLFCLPNLRYLHLLCFVLHDEEVALVQTLSGRFLFNLSTIESVLINESNKMLWLLRVAASKRRLNRYVVKNVIKMQELTIRF